MKIAAAIALLQAQQKKHGDIDVYFDCPNCRQSFAPAVVATVAVHVTDDAAPK